MKKISLYISIITILLGISNHIHAQNNILDKKQEKIVTISTFTARGDLDN